MPLSKKGQATVIIGTFSTLAAAWSAATAAIPVAGPALADTMGLTILTVAMAYLLSVLYEKPLHTAELAAFASVAIGFIAGNLALKIGASLIPLFGSYFNASVTAILHAAIGWGLCNIYESGQSPSDFSKNELIAIFKENKEKAKQEKEKYENAVSMLPPEAKREIKALQTKIKLCRSDEERNNIMHRIIEIFEQHGMEDVLE